MKVVEYETGYRIETGWWIFTWWVTFAGTGIPVYFETKERAEGWLQAMQRWEKRGNDY